MNKKKLVTAGIAALILIISIMYVNLIKSNHENYSLMYEPLTFSTTIKDSIKLIMEASFKNDNVQIKYNGKIIFDESITTDHRIGLAKSIEILRIRKADYLEIFINNFHPIKVQNLHKYNYVRLSYVEKVPKIILTNERPMYK